MVRVAGATGEGRPVVVSMIIGGGVRWPGRTHQVAPDVFGNKFKVLEEATAYQMSIGAEGGEGFPAHTPASDAAAPPVRVLFNAPFPDGSVHRPARKQCRFSDAISVGETWSSSDYERGSLTPAPLTPLLAYLIRIELNEVKAQMDIHQDSRHHTQFFPT